MGVYVSGNLGKLETVIPDRPMTIRDLLTHQSGLTYDFMNNTEVDAAYREIGVGRKGQNSLKELISSLSTIPLEFSPGDKWNYSISTDVCGYLVEVLSGMALDEFLKKNIFDPLGMLDTAFYVPEEKLHRLASNYIFQRDGEPKLI
jgi:CubicO group peptidase (beta-lactamase class C family)